MRLALELRVQGKTQNAIAQELGISQAQVHRLIDTGIQSIYAEPAATVLALELERLDMMFSGLAPRIMDGSPAAVMAGIRVMERRARLLGLDKPIEVNHRQIIEAVSTELGLTQDERAALERDVTAFYESLRERA